MRFPVRQRRQAPAVIIIALIDVLIVMLIFLLVSTTFKQHPALRLALPESSQAGMTGAGEAAPLVITVDAQGVIMLGPEALVLTPDRLHEELLARAIRDPELRLAINADQAAPFGQIVRVMDAAQAADIRRVNAFTRPPAAR